MSDDLSPEVRAAAKELMVPNEVAHADHLAATNSNHCTAGAVGVVAPSRERNHHSRMRRLIVTLMFVSGGGRVQLVSGFPEPVTRCFSAAFNTNHVIVFVV